MVIFGPICQVGCRSASAGVTASSSSARSPRNGPPDAVRISRRISDAVAAVQALVDGVVLAVDRQHRDAAPARGLHDQRAGHDEDFLVGERDRLAGLDRGQHGVERRRARRGEQHDVGVGMRRDREQSLARRRPATARAAALPRARLHARASAARCHRDRVGPKRGPARPSARSSLRPPAPTTRRRSGCAATTASALCPIEPVEPRIATRFIRTWSDSGRRRNRPARRTASCRCDRARRRGPGSVFDESLTPALRLSSDSNRSPTMPSADDARADAARSSNRSAPRETPAAADGHRQRAEHEPADRPFERLLRTDRRRQRPAAERAAGVVLGRVADRRSSASAAGRASRPPTPRTAAIAPSGRPM